MIPDGTSLLELEPEELAGTLLVYLRGEEDANSGQMNWGNFTDGQPAVDGYPQHEHDQIRQALTEAWGWLEREGLLVRRPGSNGNNGWFRLSRRARTLKTAADVAAFRLANRLPRQQLHPRISHKVWSEFLRGEYDTAVFQAFKEVEVSVRDAAGLHQEMVGVKLMRAAFHPESGPLTDRNAEQGERQARMDLFAGAIGSFKNPQSHRTVGAQADETVELLFFATHLLRIVDDDELARRLSGPKRS